MTPQLRQELEIDVNNYLQSVGVTDKEKWVKSLGVIKRAADSYTLDATSPYEKDAARSYKKYLSEIPKEEHKTFYVAIAASFAPRHYVTIKGFVQRYEKILEAESMRDEAEENQRIEALEAQREQFKDDYEYGDIPGEVVVHSDCIEITANGYREGFKESLPNAGKGFYKSEGTWKYPNNEKYRDIFCKTPMFAGCPVLYAK